MSAVGRHALPSRHHVEASGLFAASGIPTTPVWADEGSCSCPIHLSGSTCPAESSRGAVGPGGRGAVGPRGRGAVGTPQRQAVVLSCSRGVEASEQGFLVHLAHLVARDFLHQQQLRGHGVRGQDVPVDTRRPRLSMACLHNRTLSPVLPRTAVLAAAPSPPVQPCFLGAWDPGRAHRSSPGGNLRMGCLALP